MAGAESLRERQGIFLLLLLIGVVLALQCAWMWRDETPFPYGDSYAYLSRLLRALDHSEISSLSDLWQFVENLNHSGRPPMYQILTIPFIWLFGRSEDAVLGVNLLFCAVMMASVFWSARIIANRKAALLAALLIAAYPPLIGLQRMYWMHAAVPACTALSLGCLLFLLKKRTAASAWLFGGSLSFGLLMHPSFAWFWAVPALIFGLYSLLFQTEPRFPGRLSAAPGWVLAKLHSPFFSKALLPGALIALVVPSGWYLTEGWNLVDERRRMIQSTLASFRGYDTITIGFPEVPNTPLWFAATSPSVLSNILASLALFGLIHALVRPTVNMMVPAVGFLSGYLFYGVFFPVKDWYHFAPILPFVAVVTACSITRLPYIPLMRTLFFSAAGTAAFILYVTSSALPPGLIPAAAALGAPLKSSVCSWPRPVALCPHPPREWEFVRRPGRFLTSDGERLLIEKILGSPECRQRRTCRLMLVRGTAGMLPTRLLYLLARDWPGSNLHVSDDSSHIWGYPYPLDDLLRADYLVYSDLGSSDPYQAATLALFKSPPPLFVKSHRKIGNIDLVGGHVLTILRRTDPLTLEEARETIDVLELADQYKFQKYSILASMLEQAGRPHEALAYCDEGLARSELTSGMRNLLHKMKLRLQEVVDVNAATGSD